MGYIAEAKRELPHARLLVDLDNITVNFMGAWFEWYNALHPDDKKTVADATDYETGKVVKHRDDLYNIMDATGFYASLRPHPGAVETLKEFVELGHHVVIVSAPSKNPSSAAEKIAWVREYLPFLHRKDIFICNHKHMVQGHVFIDDSPANARAYRAAWPHAFIGTIAYPYNAGVPEYDLRAYGWQDTKLAWSSLRTAILTYLEPRRLTNG